ncbi:phenylacetate--CoA ligase family protein [Crenothrix sp.]|uniref:phenylacetate--CoA ligase family protein n=1 Tax=Crenothrix sp. TaxID=3100433 RepID=UPI00374CA534
MYSSTFYQQSPVAVQNAMVSARNFLVRSLRNSSKFRLESNEVASTQWLNTDDLAQLQLKRLQAMVGHAALHVPYYRDLFATAGFLPKQLVCLADMQRIPVLTKQDILHQGECMLAENLRDYRVATSTSGTTGMSLKLWRHLHSINRENAFVWRQCNWAGVKLGERRMWMRGDKIVPVNKTKPPFWRYNIAENTIMMSAYHLSEDSVEAYVQALEKFDPVFGMAYSAPLAFLARYLLNAGRRYRGKSLRCFITSSETVTDEQRQVVKEAFGVQIFDWYGSAERVSAIGTCEHGNYHILSDYGFTELIPQNDSTYTLVCTGFDNFLMPLIRYQMSDSIALADSSYACLCGRHFPVVERLIGRSEDYLLMPDGRQVFMVGGIIDGLDNILESQIRQDTPDEVRILLVPVQGSVVDEQQVILQARQLLGETIRIKVEWRNDIPKTSNGKFRAVVRSI